MIFFWKKFPFLFFIFFFLSSAFSVDPSILEQWKKTMKYGISSQRSAVIKGIEDNKASDAYGLIEEALKSDPNPEIRGSVVYTMINLKIDKEGVWLSALSSESNSDVLRKMAFGITELKVKNAGPRLFEILTNRIQNTKDSVLCASLIRAIGTIGYQGANSFIISLLTNVEYTPDIRGAAAIAVGELGDVKMIPVLQNLLENTGEIKEVRMYSAYAIGKTGDKQALSVLSPYIENENEDLNIRLWSIAGLAYVKDPSVYNVLVRFVKVDNVRLRVEAIKAFGNLKDKNAEEILIFKALYDPELSVKREAKKALQNMGVDVDKLDKSTVSSSNSNSSSVSSSNTNTAKAPEIKVEKTPAKSKSQKK
jgi:HEAT repeat protein